MYKEFQQFISKNSLFRKTDKILVTVSGGIDSVVLCHMLHHLGFTFGIAHCNFRLRAKESDEDEHFVKQLALKFNVFFHVKRFKTLLYSKRSKISVQMAARDLRYTWFDEIRQVHDYDVIAVAHHGDDETETFFINLIRGTGIAGLHGIKAKSGNIVRPLLFAGRKEIEEFATKQKIIYREDSSNSSIKYLRNRIRLQLIPLLKDLNPQIDNTIKDDIQKIRQMEEVVHDIVEEKRREILQNDGTVIKFDINKLLSLKNRSFFLFEFLKPVGFRGDIIEKISKSLKSKESKQFFSLTHRLVKDRDYMILSTLPAEEQEQTYIIEKDCKEFKEQLHLKFNIKKKYAEFEVEKKNNTGMFDFDKLSFPLSIRKWKAGDFFYPYGMKGKKKLSDYFTDRKVSIIEKEKVWLLCNYNDIIWVIGHRTDNRYRVTDKTKKAFVVKLVTK